MLANQRLTAILFFVLIILEIHVVESFPRTQKIIVQGHEWTVPNEPGWHEGKSFVVKDRFSMFSCLVLEEAEPVRQDFFSNCASSRDCRLAVEKLRQIFLKHQTSRKHFQTNPSASDTDSDVHSIFKWG